MTVLAMTSSNLPDQSTSVLKELNLNYLDINELLSIPYIRALPNFLTLSPAM
jgi:hypothetical protein